MNTLKVITKRRYLLSVEVNDETRELDLTHQGEESTIIQEENETKIVVGYLVQDSDCENPLDNDGCGKIHSLGRHHINRIDIDEAKSILESDNEAVPLSYFEHGQCLWDVQHGEKISRCPDMQWDGVGFAGVWVPDDSCRENIHMTAGNDEKKRYAKAVKCAESACEQYTSWSNGDCWGVCVDTFDKATGEKIADDACWGHVGSEWAEQALKEQIAYALKD